MPASSHHALDLDAEAGALLAGIGPKERKTKSLLREGSVSLLLIAMAADNLLASHSAPGVVTVQVIRGAIAMTIGDEKVPVAAQQAVVMPPGVVHDVLARVPSVLLLTITGAAE